MFDIGFPELVIVSIVALLVIGPERLPETVRTIALWVGRIRRSLANIKMELESEIGADEIRQQLHNETVMKELKDTKQQLDGIIRDTDGTISDLKKSASMKEIEKSLDQNDQNTHKDNDGRQQSESGR